MDSLCSTPVLDALVGQLMEEKESGPQRAGSWDRKEPNSPTHPSPTKRKAEKTAMGEEAPPGCGRPLPGVLGRTIHLLLGYPGITQLSGPVETKSVQVRVYTALLRDCFTFGPPQLQKLDMLFRVQKTPVRVFS